MLDSEKIIEIINELNGKIEPVADSAIDGYRSKAFDNYRKVFEALGNKIASVYMDEIRSPFGSCQAIGKQAQSSMKQMRVYLEDVLENN